MSQVQNINDLDQFNLPEGESSSDYVEPPKGFGPPIPGGVAYNFRIKTIRGWEKTAEGYPSVIFDAEVVDGAYEGRTLNFIRLSTKAFARIPGRKSTEADKPNTSQVYDFLRSTGYSKPFTTLMHQAGESVAAAAKRIQEAMEAAQSRTFKAEVEWDVYCKLCAEQAKAAGTKYKARYSRYSQFPSTAYNTKEYSVACTCGAQLEARARIDRYIPVQAATSATSGKPVLTAVPSTRKEVVTV